MFLVLSKQDFESFSLKTFYNNKTKEFNMSINVTYVANLDGSFDPSGRIENRLDTNDYNDGKHDVVHAKKPGMESWTIGFEKKGNAIRAIFLLDKKGDKKFQSYGNWITLGLAGSSPASMIGYTDNNIILSTIIT